MLVLRPVWSYFNILGSLLVDAGGLRGYVTAMLHKLTWLKILHCEIGSDKKYNYQFLVTPEDHPECFGTAA